MLLVTGGTRFPDPLHTTHTPMSAYPSAGSAKIGAYIRPLPSQFVHGSLIGRFLNAFSVLASCSACALVMCVTWYAPWCLVRVLRWFEHVQIRVEHLAPHDARLVHLLELMPATLTAFGATPDVYQSLWLVLPVVVFTGLQGLLLSAFVRKASRSKLDSCCAI